MLTYNVDTCDCLTNGAFGEVLGFKLKKDKSVEKVYVQFYDEDVGRERRKNHVAIQNLFPGKKVTPIELIEFEYSLAKKKWFNCICHCNAISIEISICSHCP